MSTRDRGYYLRDAFYPRMFQLPWWKAALARKSRIILIGSEDVIARAHKALHHIPRFVNNHTVVKLSMRAQEQLYNPNVGVKYRWSPMVYWRRRDGRFVRLSQKGLGRLYKAAERLPERQVVRDSNWTIN